MSAVLSWLVLLITAHLVLAIPFALTPVSTAPIPKQTARFLTNARRLQNGLPLRSPVRRTGTQHARQAAPSAVPGQTGFIRVVNRASGISLGFAAHTPGAGGIYTITNSSSEADWLRVTLPSNAAQIGTFALTTTDEPLPYFAATVGSSSASNDMGDPNTLNYYYLTSVSSDAAVNTYTRATGQDRFSETAVWTFISSNNELVPQWTNANNQAVTPSLLVFQNFLAATGSEQIFSAIFSPTQYAAFHFVSVGGTTTTFLRR